MIDYHAVQLAIRTHLLTLSVATTGATTLAASATGGANGDSAFTRAAGSFLTDGFASGMEVVASGFSAANNVTTTITALTATVMTVAATLSGQSAAAARTIAVGLPSRRAWENLDTQPEPGAPHIVEQFIPGPLRQLSIGPLGTLESTPMYALHVHAPEGTGMDAASLYATAIVQHFPPRKALTLAGGDKLRVRSDTGPFPGRQQKGAPGWTMVPVTIPFRLLTANSI